MTNVSGVASELPATSWPVWRRREAGYGQLARYVSPASLTYTTKLLANINVGSRSEDLPEQRDVELARALYQRLRDHRLEYGLQPWVPDDSVQQIRDPDWLINDGWGTCLDFATIYASMCLAARVAPLLAVTTRGAEGHAFVVVTPGRLQYGLDDVIELDGANQSGDHGVLIVDDRDQLIAKLRAGEWLVVDCVGATRQCSYEDAAFAGLARVEDEQWTLRLVDVPWLQEHSHAPPLARAGVRPALRLYLSGSPAATSYGQHTQIIELLSSASGTVVLHGASGVGKSTIGRQLVNDAPLGCGWFLNASEPQTLIHSLADAEFAQRNVDAVGYSDLEREGYAAAALSRLRETTQRWVVVLDNSDGEPTKLLPRLPIPRSNQLLLITTTNEEWTRLADVRVQTLECVTDDEAAGVLGGGDLVELVGGRPLLIDAFRRLRSATGMSSEAILRCVPDDVVDTEGLGPSTYWAALRRSPGFSEAHLRVAALASYLPPDRIPIAVLDGFAGTAQAGSVVTDLVSRGLFGQVEASETLTLHRLFGAAVRSDLGRSPTLRDEVILAVASRSDALRLLEAQGDLDTLERLEQALLAGPGDGGASAVLGVAMHGVAKALELRGQTRRSARLYEEALLHLRQSAAPEHVADALIGKARPVNQFETKDKARLRLALTWVSSAHSILSQAGLESKTGKCLAMRGLLQQKLAGFPRRGQTRVQLLHDALATLKEAHRQRLEHLEINHPELARSEFNLAGIRIELAKAERDSAAGHLDEAERVYVEVEERRRNVIYRGCDVHPHIAACIAGRAYVNYFRAMYVPSTTREKATWLREATTFALRALEQREALEGAIDQDETSKVARFLSKVAVARYLSPSPGAPRLADLWTELHSELVDGGLVQPVPRRQLLRRLRRHG